MKKLLETLKSWLLKRWWGKNLANIMTISGFIGAYWALFCTSWSDPGKLAGYVAMELIDTLDGPVARWLGNKDGIGKVIDPTADKFKKFFALYFLFQEPALVFRPIIGLVALGEIAVFILISYAVYLAFKYQSEYNLRNKIHESRKEIFKGATPEVLKNWRISQEGKLTMVCYVSMFGAIFLRSIWMNIDVLTYLYVSLAIIGFVFRAFSFWYYWKKFLDWQNKASARAAKAG